jgi:hypothetical protein
VGDAPEPVCLAAPTYYSQGLVYATAFHLVSHLWLMSLAVLVLWPWRPPSTPPGRRFLAYTVPAVLAYETTRPSGVCYNPLRHAE